MSGWWIFYTICFCMSAGGFIFMTWWDLRKGSADPIRLSDILLGIFLTVCPIVNTFVSIGMFIWFINDVAPRIVVIRGSGK